MKTKLIVCLSLLLMAVQCKKEEKISSTETGQSGVAQQQETKDSVGTPTTEFDSVVTAAVKDSVPNPSPFAEGTGTYTSMVFPKNQKKKDSMMAAFKEKYTPEQRYVILALNRLDTKNAYRADTLVIPTKFEDDFRSYSPFPAQVPALSDVKKMVIFSYPIQAFAVYTNGNLEKWGPTSMGKKKSPTKTGLTFANWKKELSISTVSDEWKLPYNFNIYNHLGIGWHEYDLPGYPASHSCLRLLRKDAEFLFHYADQWVLNKGGATTKAKGTPVLVFGEYAWGKRKPWKILDKDPNATTVSVEELENLITPVKDQILKEQQNRDVVISQMLAKAPAKKDSI